MTKPPKRPRDPNQLAKAIVDIATMDEIELAEFRRNLADQGAATMDGASMKSNKDVGASGGDDKS